MATREKINRMLMLYSTLMKGQIIYKNSFSMEYGISERSFDRDINHVRVFLSESFSGYELIYDRKQKGYRIKNLNVSKNLSPMEIILLATILKETRCLREDEFDGLLFNIIETAEQRKKEQLRLMAKKIRTSYHPVHHDKALLKLFWDLQQCIYERNIIVLKYEKRNGEYVERRVCPLGIEFSEYYFYLIGMRTEKQYEYPAFFRLDRIESFQVTICRYEEDVLEKYKKFDLKQHLKYMQAGTLLTVTVWCENRAKENLLDVFEDCQIIKEEERGSLIAVKVFKEGFIQWVLGQGSGVIVLGPEEVKEEVRFSLENTIDRYKNDYIEKGEKKWEK